MHLVSPQPGRHGAAHAWPASTPSPANMRAPARDAGEFRRHRAHRARMCVAGDAERGARGRAGRRHRARRHAPSRCARRGRLPIERITAVHGVSVRPVPRLDLRARASCRCSPGRCRAAGANRRPRPPAAAVRSPCIASATRNGRACANFATATRRARWRGPRMRAAAACWSKTYESPAAHHRTVRPRRGAGRRCRAAPRADCRRGSSPRMRAANVTGCGSTDRELPPDSGNEHRARCLNGPRASWQR